jgi:hypothetical protein
MPHPGQGACAWQQRDAGERHHTGGPMQHGSWEASLKPRADLSAGGETFHAAAR